MRFTELALPGAFTVELEPIVDARGSFARSFCREEFLEHGLEPDVVQCNVSYNERAGTLRGMHYQREPHGEAKLIRCVRGRIYDVLVDLRPGSPAYTRWLGIELSDDSPRTLYVPRGMAHGFVTLSDDVELHYQMSAPYVPEAAAGFRWDDPAFAIEWPIERPRLSEKDATYPDWAPSPGS